MRSIKKYLNKAFIVMLSTSILSLSFNMGLLEDTVFAKDDVIKLSICNWEEYIDLGDWDEEEAIYLGDDTVIYGENSMVEDFEQWYYE